MCWNYTCAFIAKEKSSISCERLLMNWNTVLSNLNPTDFNIILIEILFCLFRTSKPIKIDMLIRSMITKKIELFHGFHFLTLFRFIRNINNLFQTKCACTSDYVSDIIFLGYVMKEEIAFG
jgi:hypothetical protein